MPSSSIWLQGRSQTFEALRGEERADVLVIGGGITGLTAAYLLGAAGVGVAVLEARTIGSGETGHGTAHITSQHGLMYALLLRRLGLQRAALVAGANESAIHLIAGIVGAEELQCDFVPQDSYVFTDEPARLEAVEREAEAASRLGIQAEATNAARFVLPYLMAVRFRNQAMFHPVKYLDGLAVALRRNGGRVYENSPVVRMGGGLANTDGGTVRARCVLVATHSPMPGSPAWYRGLLTAGCGVAASVENAPPPVGMWQDCADGMTFRACGDKLLAGFGGGRRAGRDEARLQEDFRRRLAERFPRCGPAAIWPVRSVHTPDGLPYVGKYTAKSGCLFAAAGFGRWGITGGTLAGHILCDLVLDKKNPYAELCSPQRLPGPAAAARAAVRCLADGWRQAVGKLGLGGQGLS